MAVGKIEPDVSVVIKETRIEGHIDNAIASLKVVEIFEVIADTIDPSLSFALEDHHVLSIVSVRKGNEIYAYEVCEVPRSESIFSVPKTTEIQRSINRVILKIGAIKRGQHIEVTANVHIMGLLHRVNEIIFSLPFQPGSASPILSLNIIVKNNQVIATVIVPDIQSTFSDSRLIVSGVPFSDQLSVVVQTPDPIVSSAITAVIRGKRYIGLAPRARLGDIQGYTAELIVLIDNSGSMCGKELRQAKLALKSLIQKFPQSCYFNVISFETDFVRFFEETVPCSEENLEQANQRLNEMEAEGGTQLLAPMRFVYDQPVRRGFVRQLFLLTDGGVNNKEAILTLVFEHRSDHRIMSFGIGDYCDRIFFEELATRSGGHAVFIQSENIQDAVDTQWNFCSESFGGTVVNIQAKLNDFDNVEVSPSPIPSLFANSITHTFMRTTNTTSPISTVTIIGQSGTTDFRESIAVRTTPTAVELDKFMGSSWIKDQEAQLATSEQGQAIDITKKIIEESVETNVLSIFTVRVRQLQSANANDEFVGTAGRGTELSDSRQSNPPKFQPFTEAQAATRDWLRADLISQCSENQMLELLTPARPLPVEHPTGHSETHALTEDPERIWNASDFRECQPSEPSRRCSVYRSIDPASTVEYVVKRLPKCGPITTSMIRDFSKVILPLRKLNHSCILPIRMFKFPESGTNGLLCMEYQNKGSLAEIFENITEHSWWDTTKKTVAIVGIALGMQYLHNQELIHGALRPSNILFDDAGSPKVADFAYVQLFNHCHIKIVGMNDPQVSYSALEIRDQKFTKESDIFSWGLIVVSILTNSNNVAINMKRWGRPKWEIPDLNERITTLINQCLDLTPNSRPTFDEILTALDAADYNFFGDVNPEDIRDFLTRSKN
jgi:hypothetical protein